MGDDQAAAVASPAVDAPGKPAEVPAAVEVPAEHKKHKKSEKHHK